MREKESRVQPCPAVSSRAELFNQTQLDGIPLFCCFFLYNFFILKWKFLLPSEEKGNERRRRRISWWCWWPHWVRTFSKLFFLLAITATGWSLLDLVYNWMRKSTWSNDWIIDGRTGERESFSRSARAGTAAQQMCVRLRRYAAIGTDGWKRYGTRSAQQTVTQFCCSWWWSCWARRGASAIV